VALVGRRRWLGRDKKKNKVQCVHMYVNAKIIPVETVPGMGVGIKESSGGDEFKYDIFDIF
jgi:hypothetical protein